MFDARCLVSVRRLGAIGVSFVASAVFVVGATNPTLAQDAPVTVIHVTDSPIPKTLDLHGKAVAPESELLSCPATNRRRMQPDLDAISRLVARAGGMRMRRPGFAAGAPIRTADGLVFSLAPTPNGSYVISIDATHPASGVDPQAYFDPCVRMVNGPLDGLKGIGLLPPPMGIGGTGSDMAQYSPAVGFYLLTDN